MGGEGPVVEELWDGGSKRARGCGTSPPPVLKSRCWRLVRDQPGWRRAGRADGARGRISRCWAPAGSSSPTRGSRQARISFRCSNGTGFWTKSIAPRRKHSRAWSSVTTPEMATTGDPRGLDEPEEVEPTHARKGNVEEHRIGSR